jgi:hypothetical protein
MSLLHLLLRRNGERERDQQQRSRRADTVIADLGEQIDTLRDTVEELKNVARRLEASHGRREACE